MFLAFLSEVGAVCDLHLIYYLVLREEWFPVNLKNPNLCLLVEFPAMNAIVFLCPEAFPKIPISASQQS